MAKILLNSNSTPSKRIRMFQRHHQHRQHSFHLILVLVYAFSLLSLTRAWQAPMLQPGKVQITTTGRAATTSTTTRLHMTSSQVDDRYFDAYISMMDAPPIQQTTTSPAVQCITLTRYLDQIVLKNPEMYDMVSLLNAVKMACKTISNLVHRAGLNNPLQQNSNDVSSSSSSSSNNGNNDNAKDDDYADGRFYSMRRLDQLSTIVLKNALRYTGKCEIATPQSHHENERIADHQPGVLIAKSIDSQYVAVLDPLDGSGNADASICTGTVFGVFEKEKDDEQKQNHPSGGGGGGTSSSGSSSREGNEEDAAAFIQELERAVLQPAQNMRAAGYCLYSSATVLVFTFGPGTGVQGFTLDPQVQEFVLTHPNITIPSRGTVYSCNEANSEGWTNYNDVSRTFGEYLKRLKTGTNQSGKRYAHRYVGSMVGDVHRTLLYGGIFAYPSDSLSHPYGNLQLLYKTAPLAFIVATAGGRAIQAPFVDLLTIRPERVHQKSPCFLGSPLDVAEFESMYNTRPSPPPPRLY
jgi:fructose-1,6-bisphosphatase I